nr:tripartite tricarboxylate transporter TctB family protein [Micromonospora sp. DSM 115978]
MPQTDTTQRPYLRRRIAYLGGVWIFAIAFLWQALVLPPPSRPTPVSASTFPTIVGIAMVIAATGMLAGAVIAYRRAATDPAPANPAIPATSDGPDPAEPAATDKPATTEEPAATDKPAAMDEPATTDEPAAADAFASAGPNGEELVSSRFHLVVALAATVGYVAVFFPLGYLLATVLLLTGMGAYFWRRPVASLLIAVALAVGIGWLFSLLGITLPPGLLALPF